MNFYLKAGVPHVAGDLKCKVGDMLIYIKGERWKGYIFVMFLIICVSLVTN
jgi:hypothetical protein